MIYLFNSLVFCHFSLPLHFGNWGNIVLFLFSHNKNITFCSNCQLFTSLYFLNHLPFSKTLEVLLLLLHRYKLIGKANEVKPHLWIVI